MACGCPTDSVTGAATKGDSVVEGDVVFELPEFVYTHVALMHVTRVYRGESGSLVVLFARGNCGAFASYGHWVVTRYGSTEYDACSGTMPTSYLKPSDWTWLGAGERPQQPMALLASALTLTAVAIWFGVRKLGKPKD